MASRPCSASQGFVLASRPHQDSRHSIDASGVLAIDFADTVKTRQAPAHTNDAKQAISSDRPHDRISRERVLARVSNQVFHSVEAVEPVQATAKRKNSSETRWKWVPRQNTRWGWVATEPISPPYNRH